MRSLTVITGLVAVLITFPIMAQEVNGDNPALVVDDSDENFSLLGRWITQSGVGLKGGYHEHYDSTSAFNEASWEFANILPGKYVVYVTWPAIPSLSIGVPYAVYDGDTLLGRLFVNQRIAPSDTEFLSAGWKSIGTFTITDGALVTVKYRVRGDDRFRADAVALVRALEESSGEEQTSESGAVLEPETPQEHESDPPSRDDTISERLLRAREIRKERICSRVHLRISNEQVLSRLNVRLQTRFGFTCSESGN